MLRGRGVLRLDVREGGGMGGVGPGARLGYKLGKEMDMRVAV